MSFIQHWGRVSGVNKIAVAPGPEGPGRAVDVLDGIRHPGKVDFDVNAPVFERDRLEWTTPVGPGAGLCH